MYQQKNTSLLKHLSKIVFPSSLLLPALAHAEEVTFEYVLISFLSTTHPVLALMVIITFATGAYFMFYGIHQFRGMKKNPNVRPVEIWANFLTGLILVVAVQAYLVLGSGIWGGEADESMAAQVQKTQDAANGDVLMDCLKSGNCSKY